MTEPNDAVVGWHPDEVAIGAPTRNSRLRWVIVVALDLTRGEAVNAAACVAAQAGHAIAGLLGPAGHDTAGALHPGLPWAGCTVLGAPADAVTQLRHKAEIAGDVTICDMPSSAQTNRVYADYLDELSRTPPADLQLRALSLFGSRNRISKLTGRLALLT